MNSFFKFIPGIAQETKQQVSKALNNFSKEDKSYFSKEVLNNKSEIMKNLDSQYSVDITDGLKILLANLVLGKSIKQYVPQVIGLIPSENNEIKRLVYVIISEISIIPEYQEDLLMCISSLHKNVLNPKSVQKGDALKTLSSLTIKETNSLLLSTLNKLVNDRSGYPKKIVLNSFGKLIQRNSDLKQQDLFDTEAVKEGLQPMLKDRPYVLATALQLFTQLDVDQKMEWVHEHFFNICKHLSSFNCFDVIQVLQILHKYAKIYFSHAKNGSSEDNKDLQVLLKACEKLLVSTHPSIVIEVGNILMDFPGSEQIIKKYVKALLRFVSISSESKIIVLFKIEQIAKKFPQLFRKQYRFFFLIQLEKTYCKRKKIQILEQLVDSTNYSVIIEELAYYTRSNQDEVAIEAIYSLGQLALKDALYSQQCTKALLALLKTQKFIDPVIFTLICMIKTDIKANIPILIFCMKKLEELQSPSAKAKLIENLNIVSQEIPTMATEYLRKLAQMFKEESIEVRSMILQLAFQLLQNSNSEDKNAGNVFNLFKYVLTLSLYDNDIILRDKARLIKNLVFQSQVIQDKDVLGFSDISQIIGVKLSTENLIELQTQNEHQQTILKSYEQFDRNSFYIGSLSHLVNSRMSNYQDLPFEHEYCTEESHLLRMGQGKQINQNPKDASQQPENQKKEEKPKLTTEERQKGLFKKDDDELENQQKQKIDEQQQQEQQEKQENNQEEKQEQKQEDPPVNQKMQSLEKDLDDFFS